MKDSATTTGSSKLLGPSVGIPMSFKSAGKAKKPSLARPAKSTPKRMSK